MKAKMTGARYVMPVAEHHDGYKMYDSELSRWTTVKQAMHRDVLGELKRECEKQGVVFAASSHRAEHFWFVNGAKTIGYKNDATDPEYEDLYGPCANVNKRNDLLTLLKQEKGIVPTKEWLTDWLVSSCELIDKYRPATLFFDWWVMNEAFRPYMKKFLAYYYNKSLEWGKEVCVQYKSDAIMYKTVISTANADSSKTRRLAYGRAKRPRRTIHGVIVRPTNSKSRAKSLRSWRTS